MDMLICSRPGWIAVGPKGLHGRDWVSFDERRARLAKRFSAA